ncbi:hypothetical protein [Streptomyces sp. NPDC056361]|uniref:hypothetical protein n=1 Tax=Streptomyces sp. NPDC056361 TaxID=3345795 RepID=UPI0035DEA611
MRPGLDATAVAALIGYVDTGAELETCCPYAPADAPWPPERGPVGNTAPCRAAPPTAAPCEAPPRNASAASGS